ncbi:MAG: hypothetical protein ABJA98_18700 [Acidobacteriota bacterium]
MKSTVTTAVFFGMLIGSARAEGIVTVKVPFPFFVDHQEFPAGDYDIREIEDLGTVVSIEGIKNRSSAFVLTIPAAGGDPAGDQPALVFIRYENKYRLSEIWESRPFGRALPGLPAPGKISRLQPENEPSETRAYVIAANWK